MHGLGFATFVVGAGAVLGLGCLPFAVASLLRVLAHPRPSPSEATAADSQEKQSEATGIPEMGFRMVELRGFGLGLGFPGCCRGHCSHSGWHCEPKSRKLA